MWLGWGFDNSWLWDTSGILYAIVGTLCDKVDRLWDIVGKFLDMVSKLDDIIGGF